MTIKNHELILIDVDGTMIDSAPDIAFCVDGMMARLGLPARGEARVRLWVGNGAELLLNRALTGRMDGEPDREVYERAAPIFFDLYAQNVSTRSRLYVGVEEGLDFLYGAGYRLGAVTNKPERFTLPLLTTMGLRDYFEIVVSGDSLPEKKPHPMPLLHAADVLGVAPSLALMLGDSSNDVEAARAAGFQIVCVSYGYNHGQDILAARPDAVIDSLTELAALLT